MNNTNMVIRMKKNKILNGPALSNTRSNYWILMQHVVYRVPVTARRAHVYILPMLLLSVPLPILPLCINGPALSNTRSKRLDTCSCSCSIVNQYGGLES